MLDKFVDGFDRLGGSIRKTKPQYLLSLVWLESRSQPIRQ